MGKHAAASHADGGNGGVAANTGRALPVSKQAAPRVHAGACELLQACSVSLAPSRELLLELVLALATDPWPQVAAPARAWLQQHQQQQQQQQQQQAPDQAAGGASAVPNAMLGMVPRLLQGLVPALQRGEDAGIMHARQLATALQVREPSGPCAVD